MFPEFILPTALDSLTKEANDSVNEAYFCNNTHNAYLTETNPELSQNDLSNRHEQTFVGSVAYDRINQAGLLNRLYLWNPLKNFLGYVLNKNPFFRFADPLGACSINVFIDGGQHGWHFDESEFTVALMLQQPEEGGVFEYVLQIRGLENEKQIVQHLQDGHRKDIVQLSFTPGILLIFGGQQTIHRVTQVYGDTPRLVSILCYAEQPNLVNSEAVRKLFWGRSAS
jgi:hypothetical protein